MHLLSQFHKMVSRSQGADRSFLLVNKFVKKGYKQTHSDTLHTIRENMRVILENYSSFQTDVSEVGQPSQAGQQRLLHLELQPCAL